MKKTREFFLVGVFLLLRTFVVPAQGLQLLRNVGFDTLVRCPTDLTQYMDTLPYPFEHWGVEMTPDAFHGCAANPYVSVPSNKFGYAEDSVGGYAGALAYNYYYSDSTGYWDNEMLTSRLCCQVLPGDTVTITFKYHKAQWMSNLGPDCGFKIILGTDTILTPLLPNQWWTVVDTTIVMSSVADSIKIGPGGNLGPMVAPQISSYYYFDDIQIWRFANTVVIGIEEPPKKCIHEWNPSVMVGGYEMKSCRICNERSATMRR